MKPESHTSTEARAGVLFAASSFAIWGVVPIYFKQLGDVPSTEIILHRVVWTVAVTGIIMMATTRGKAFRSLFQNPHRFLGLGASATCIASNWIFFVWAVNSGRVLETSLGYFINPLLSVLLGTLLLGERLRPPQMFAVALAASGVVLSVILFGKLPWISLILAFSFGGYGLLRKQINIDGVTGLFTETLLLLPIALAYFLYLHQNNSDHFVSGGSHTRLFLIGTGLVTAAPLVLFATGARRIKLSTIGILQYIAPSLSFLVGVFLYNEPFTQDRFVTFGLIWIALVLYTFDAIRENRRIALAGQAAAQSV